jgi:hypothetical protein
MKRSTLYILAGALVLLILLTASCACCDFKPHSKKVSFSKYEGMEGEEEMKEENLEEPEVSDEEIEGFGYPYEGMEDEEEYVEGMDDMPEEEDAEEEADSVEESMINKMKQTLGLAKEKEGMKSSIEPCAYDNSVCGNYDIYGPPTKGSLDCGAKSAGLSNSKGPLCLSDKQLKLLSTRGGNASTDAQIGA